LDNSQTVDVENSTSHNITGTPCPFPADAHNRIEITGLGILAASPTADSEGKVYAQKEHIDEFKTIDEFKDKTDSKDCRGF